MQKRKILERIDERWRVFNSLLEGLTDDVLEQPGNAGEWSFKDVIGHIATWEDETLKALPLLMEGLRPPRYGGIDRFNAREVARKRKLTLEEVRRQAAETHARVLSFVRAMPEQDLAAETRFVRRLRLDTYGHYPMHSAVLRAYRRAHGIEVESPRS